MRQSAMAFCRQYGLKYPTFVTWVQKRRGGSEPALPRFPEVSESAKWPRARALRLHFID